MCNIIKKPWIKAREDKIKELEVGQNKDLHTVSEILVKVWAGSILHVFLFNDTEGQSSNKNGSFKGVGIKTCLSNCVLLSEAGNQVKIQLRKLSRLSQYQMRWVYGYPRSYCWTKLSKVVKIPQTFTLPWDNMQGLVSSIVLTYALSLETRPEQ